VAVVHPPVSSQCATGSSHAAVLMRDAVFKVGGPWRRADVKAAAPGGPGMLPPRGLAAFHSMRADSAAANLAVRGYVRTLARWIRKPGTRGSARTADIRSFALARSILARRPPVTVAHLTALRIRISRTS